MGQSSSDLFAARTEVGEDGVDAVLVDGAQGLGGYTDLDPAAHAADPEAALMQVRHEAAAGLVHVMRDVVSGRRTLAGDLAYTGHYAPRRVRLDSPWPGKRRPRQATGCGWRAMRENVRPLGGAGTGGPESRFRGAALPVMRRLDTASRALWQGGGGGARGGGKAGTGNREQGTGNREQGTGNREQGTGNREQGTGKREQGAGKDKGGAGCGQTRSGAVEAAR